jgi:hypothetical protein
LLKVIQPPTVSVALTRVRSLSVEKGWQNRDIIARDTALYQFSDFKRARIGDITSQSATAIEHLNWLYMISCLPRLVLIASKENVHDINERDTCF